MTATKPRHGPSIRCIGREDEPAWRALWQDYLEFYKTALDPFVTDRTWSNVLESREMFGLGAHQGDTMIGFALVVVHRRTWSPDCTAYLEDLYVDHRHRREGAARLLIDEAICQARLRGCSTLYWHTHAANAAARSLYDRYCLADQTVRYRLQLTLDGG